MSNSNPRLRLLRVITVALAITLLTGWFLTRKSIEKTHAQALGFKYFEWPQIHPLAVTPDGTRLLAANTPNASLSVFYITGNTLSLMAEIPVGLEPVSVAVRNNGEAWVANWLSDSVSVVDLNRFKVSRTFDVGDE